MNYHHTYHYHVWLLLSLTFVVLLVDTFNYQYDLAATGPSSQTITCAKFLAHSSKGDAFTVKLQCD